MKPLIILLSLLVLSIVGKSQVTFGTGDPYPSTATALPFGAKESYSETIDSVVADNDFVYVYKSYKTKINPIHVSSCAVDHPIGQKCSWTIDHINEGKKRDVYGLATGKMQLIRTDEARKVTEKKIKEVVENIEKWEW